MRGEQRLSPFGKRRNGMYDYEVEHIERLRKLLPECMVLLKKNKKFPLKQAGKIALYGSGARKTIKGGTGSGDVNVRQYVTVEDGLKNAGFEITTTEWLDQYDDCIRDAHQVFVGKMKAKIVKEGFTGVLAAMGAVMPEPEYDFPLSGEGDTAIYVLSRISGEGSDRQNVKGDFMLSDTEVRDILKLQKTYDKFLLVLNVGGPVDLSPVLDDVENILVLSQLGISIGDALADVIIGKSYPSGKLTSTWARYEDYCNVGDFAMQDDTHYKEGIYVGYRYFDTTGIKPLFPFGFGLGYAEFAFANIQMTYNKNIICAKATIENIGQYVGKEAIQLYVSIPFGKLDQPYQVLAAFAKSEELKPGEKQEVELSFDMASLCSFEEETRERILESGTYVIRIGNSSHDTKVIGIVELKDRIVVEKVGSVGGNADFKDMKLTYKNTKEVVEADIVLTGADFEQDTDATVEEKLPFDAEADALVADMTDEELAYICVGGFEDEGSNSVIGNAGLKVAGAAGETTSIFLEKGIPTLVMADGPAGLRLSKQYGKDEQGVYSLDEGSLTSMFEMIPEPMIEALHLNDKKPERHGEIFDQYCTAIPIGTALAQSWNVKLAYECGDIVGTEMERFGVNLWLAPALNIHRNPLCGRNFEYYSEDPLISGKMAAAITKGVQKHPGCGVTIKHFVVNNQETNRFRSNSIVSQRALRDIYLKGFEIVVKEAAPKAVMSSYNLLNGEHTSARKDLLETLLREEWNFKGVVMSDWVIQGVAGGTQHKYPAANAAGAIQAGNDIMMPGGKTDHADLMQALKETHKGYKVTHEDLLCCAKRVVRLALELKG